MSGSTTNTENKVIASTEAVKMKYLFGKRYRGVRKK
jgi:hypothetical protein